MTSPGAIWNELTKLRDEATKESDENVWDGLINRYLNGELTPDIRWALYDMVSMRITVLAQLRVLAALDEVEQRLKQLEGQ